jgi:hypothetical protein
MLAAPPLQVSPPKRHDDLTKSPSPVDPHDGRLGKQVGQGGVGGSRELGEAVQETAGLLRREKKEEEKVRYDAVLSKGSGFEGLNHTSHSQNLKNT